MPPVRAPQRGACISPPASRGGAPGSSETRRPAAVFSVMLAADGRLHLLHRLVDGEARRLLTRRELLERGQERLDDGLRRQIRERGAAAIQPAASLLESAQALVESGATNRAEFDRIFSQ